MAAVKSTRLSFSYYDRREPQQRTVISSEVRNSVKGGVTWKVQTSNFDQQSAPQHNRRLETPQQRWQTGLITALEDGVTHKYPPKVACAVVSNRQRQQKSPKVIGDKGETCQKHRQYHQTRSFQYRQTMSLLYPPTPQEARLNGRSTAQQECRNRILDVLAHKITHQQAGKWALLLGFP